MNKIFSLFRTPQRCRGSGCAWHGNDPALGRGRRAPRWQMCPPLPRLSAAHPISLPRERPPPPAVGAAPPCPRLYSRNWDQGFWGSPLPPAAGVAPPFPEWHLTFGVQGSRWFSDFSMHHGRRSGRGPVHSNLSRFQVF